MSTASKIFNRDVDLAGQARLVKGSQVIIDENGNIVGGGLENPMPNGTFLETIDKDDNVIPLIGYFSELVAMGDYEFGNETIIVSSDNFTTYQSTLSVGQDGIASNIEDVANSVEITQGIDLPNIEFEKRYETAAANATGASHRNIMLSELPANNDILHTYTDEGANDSLGNTNYGKKVVTAVDILTGSEQGKVEDFVMIAGSETLATTKDSNGITHSLLTRQAAEIVTGGIAYMAFETGYNTDAYGWQFGAGTTVPGAVSGWNGGAIFTDADAVGVNRTWLNIGTSSSASFRRVAYWDNAAAYTVTNDTPSRTFDADTVTLPQLADIVATLLRDLNIT